MLKRNHGILNVFSIALNDYLKAQGFNPIKDEESAKFGENGIIYRSDGKGYWRYTATDMVRIAYKKYNERQKVLNTI
jgi:hypothetical protein